MSGDRLAAVSQAPVVVQARDVTKTFRVSTHRIDTLKERFTQRRGRGDIREIAALRGISFDVHQGEFFGIVGRNGSGKSTLLKIMASIYRPDAGRVRMAGRLAPFIELGVGFDAELTARENVALNGVLMGLGRREARGRLGAVLEFAELEEFANLKLKNYSSGMLVRLAFAIMVEADADIMLIDEVLAVGDAAFARKCMDVFRAKRRAGKTIVLVTHDMATVQTFCDRAMVVHDGELRYLGDPEQAALEYYRLNFAGEGVDTAAEREVPDLNVSVVEAWLESPAGERVENVEQGAPIGFNLLLEARRDLDDPGFAVHFHNEEGAEVFGFNPSLGDATRVPEGGRIRLAGTVENPLLPGRYFVDLWVARNREHGAPAMHRMHVLDFVVFGTRPGAGNVSVGNDVRARVEGQTG
jgi:ABC-type polysaccharide/polyol phosphate transport system ATPase subunit